MPVMPTKSKNPNLSVETLQDNHSEELRCLDEICMGFKRGWNKSTWETCTGFVAKQRDVLAGAIHIVTIPMGKTSGVILIGKIIVLPDCRRQGVGTALINRVKKKSLVGRIKYVTANVFEDDLDVCCFFRANGFEVVLPPKKLGEKKYYLMRWKVTD